MSESENVLATLFGVLQLRAGFEVVNQNVTPNQIRIIHRVSKAGMPNWLMVMDQLLDAGEVAQWKVDLSKQYFKRNGSLIYGWRFIIQAEDVIEHLPAILQVVEKAPRATMIIEEQPLAGVSASRNALKRGKGAQSPLNAKVGPSSWGR